jgi:hypothetical protein
VAHSRNRLAHRRPRHRGRGANLLFDQAGDSTAVNDLAESHAADRWRVLLPGTYTVRVLYKVTDPDTRFGLDDWSLIVERAS